MDRFKIHVLTRARCAIPFHHHPSTPSSRTPTHTHEHTPMDRYGSDHRKLNSNFLSSHLLPAPPSTFPHPMFEFRSSLLTNHIQTLLSTIT